MSNKHNQQWLESAKENFEQAIADKNWHLAHSVLQDLNDNGFEKVSDELFQDIRKAQEDGMAKTGEMTIDDVYGEKMVKITFGSLVPHIRLNAKDVDRMITALKDARKLL